MKIENVFDGIQVRLYNATLEIPPNCSLHVQRVDLNSVLEFLLCQEERKQQGLNIHYLQRLISPFPYLNFIAKLNIRLQELRKLIA